MARNTEIQLLFEAETARAEKNITSLGNKTEGIGKTMQEVSKQAKNAAKYHDRLGTQVRRLAEDEAALRSEFKRGAIDAKRYERAMAGIARKRKDLANLGKLDRAAMIQTAGVQQNLAQLLNYAAVGDWTMAGNQIRQLGIQLRVTTPLFTAMGFAVGGTVGLLAALAATAGKGYLEMREMEKIQIAYGNSLGVTTGQLLNQRDALAESTGAYGDAQAAVVALAKSGAVTQDSLQSAGEAALNLAKLTGQSIDDTTKEVIKLAKAPTKSLNELNEQYNFLTLEVYDNVKALEEQGQAQEAAKLALDQLASVTESRAREMEASAGLVEKAWAGVKEQVSKAIAEVKNYGRTDTEAELSRLNRRASQLGDARNRARAFGVAGLFGGYFDKKAQEELAEISKRREALRGIRDEEEQIAKQKAEQAEAQAAGIKAADAVDKLLEKQLSKQQKQKKALAELAQQYRAIANANANDKRLAGVVFGADGSIKGGGFDRGAAAIRAQYAEKGRGGGSGRGSAGATKARDPNESALRAIDNIQKQIYLLNQLEEGQKANSEAEKIRWEVTEGAHKNATQAVKDQLLAEAENLDAIKAAREAEANRVGEVAKLEKEYENLRKAMRTPTEAAVETAIIQVNTLREALRGGIVDKQTFDDTMARIVDTKFDDAPQFAGLDASVGGAFGELQKVYDGFDELEKWYGQKLELIKSKREQELITEAEYNRQLQELEAEHNEQMNRLKSAETQAYLVGFSTQFGQMAEIAKQAYGEQSKAYRMMFALSKGFAIAQSAVSLAIAVARATEKPFPANIPLIAKAFAQGAQVASLIASATFGGGKGYASGGYTGDGGKYEPAGVVHRGEFVVQKAVVQKQGVLQMLARLNRTGKMPGYMEGGLVARMPESFRGGLPSVPSFVTQERNFSPTVENNQRFFAMFDSEMLAEKLVETQAFGKATVMHVGLNGSEIKGQWER